MSDMSQDAGRMDPVSSHNSNTCKQRNQPKSEEHLITRTNNCNSEVKYDVIGCTRDRFNKV